MFCLLLWLKISNNPTHILTKSSLGTMGYNNGNSKLQSFLGWGRSMCVCDWKHTWNITDMLMSEGKWQDLTGWTGSFSRFSYYHTPSSQASQGLWIYELILFCVDYGYQNSECKAFTGSIFTHQSSLCTVFDVIFTLAKIHPFKT